MKCWPTEGDGLLQRIRRIQSGLAAGTDMTQRYGKLTITSIQPGSKNHHRMALCTCDCGGARTVRVTKLGRGLVSECARCSMETARLAGRLSRRRLPALERRIRDSYGVYSGNAARKGLPFQIPLDHFRSLVTSACRYCGEADGIRGIDRLNSGLGYSFANCVACCSICNYAKRQMSVEAFLAWVKRVYERIG